MKPAIVVVYMLRGTLEGDHPMSIKELGKAIVPMINRLTGFARIHSLPVFCMDSFLSGDFIFQGKIKNYLIRGTKGAEVTDLLIQAETDIYSPKRRFSAFYKADLGPDIAALRSRHGGALRHCNTLVHSVLSLRRPVERFPRGHSR
jgi:nicotinamidase-related amidase